MGWQVGVEAGAQAANAAGGLFSTIFQAANQQKVWKREDSAVQRRTADLKAAGLSPTLAAGSAAQTSGPISPGNPMADVDAGAIGEAAKREEEEKLIKAQTLNTGMNSRYTSQLAANAFESHKGIIQNNQRLMAEASIKGMEMTWARDHGLPSGAMNTPAGQAIMIMDATKGMNETDRVAFFTSLAATRISVPGFIK